MKKRRADSFFGIHFDFHAMPGQTVCDDFRPDVVARALDAIKPDFVQCDTKGHPGLSSYSTAVGNRADAIAHDPLRMWRELTEKRGIALYGHHSGLFDRRVAADHPDWAIVKADGTVSDSYLSPFSPYADEILIPQLIELCDTYRLDGAWIDGECWGAYVDYSPWAAAAWQAAGGGEPPREGEDGYASYCDFCRQGFRDYIAKYVTALHDHDPNFQITSNWIYSAYMPEPVTVKVDFLSGDYSNTNAMESARFNGRAIAARGMTWDLMMWGQNAIPGSWQTRNRSTKELVQYCQEAAEIVAQGGGFQYFNIMYGHGGTVQEWAIPMWAKVAEFCRARQDACFGAKLVPQIGVLFPPHRTPATSSGCLYSMGMPNTKAVNAWINLLQDMQLSTSIVYPCQLGEARVRDYPVLVVPACDGLDEDAITGLTAYVRAGGRLLIDRGAAVHMPQLCGEVGTGGTALIWLDSGGALAAAETQFAPFSPDEAVTGWAYDDNYDNGRPIPAAVRRTVGKGSMILLGLDLGETYRANRTTAAKTFCRLQLDALGFVPAVTITGRGADYTDLVLTEKDGGLRVNLINFSGPHQLTPVRSYGAIPLLGPLTVTVRCAEPKLVRLIPDDGTERFAWQYRDGAVELTLDRLDIHTCICIE